MMLSYSSGADDGSNADYYYNSTTTSVNPNAIDGRLSSPNSLRLELRKRDAVAMLVCLLLLRLAFAPSADIHGEFVSHTRIDASMILSFYYPFQSNAAATVTGHERQHNEVEHVDDDNKDNNASGTRRWQTAQPVPLDIDGDGVFDSLAMPVFLTRENLLQEEELELAEKRSRHHRKTTATNNKMEDESLKRSSEWPHDGSWGLRILDLRPLHHSHHRESSNDGAMIAFDGPFAPRTLFLSPLLQPSKQNPKQYRDEGEDANQSQQQTKTTTLSAYPIKLLSIQIPIQRTKLGEEEKFRQRHKKDGTEKNIIGSYGKNPNIPSKEDPLHHNYDRTRHYFCGRDWHHASQSCHRHCGGGLSSECGEGETCYADTPCDVHLEPSVDNSYSRDEESVSMALTKGGTLPGIVAVWSDGSVSLHVITADVITATSAATATTTSSSASTVGVGGQHPHQQHPHQRAARASRHINKNSELELRQLWRVYPFEPISGIGGGEESNYSSGGESIINFDELGITFESGAIYGDAAAVDNSSGNEGARKHGENGAILLGGQYTIQSKSRRTSMRVSFHALDALSGRPLWDLNGSHHNKLTGMKNSSNDEPRIPIIHTTSSARRRSHLPVSDVLDPELDNENAFVEGDNVMTSEECMAHFRTSVLDGESGALPHEFFGEFGSMNVGRFDRSKGYAGKRRKLLGKKGLQLLDKIRDGPRVQHDSGTTMTGGGIGQGRGASIGLSSAISGNSGTTSSGRSWQSDLFQRAVPQRLIRQHLYKSRHPHMGKPNVVIFHGREGLAVLSLKNGLPVCHISLMDNALYADVDQDGVIDTVQVITTSESVSKSSAVRSLIHRISGPASERQEQADAPLICHAFVTSGLPPREEVFTAPLCLGGPINPHRSHLSAAPPLLVEGSLGYGSDIVFAVNNGVVARFDFNGHEVWRKRGGLKDGTPNWNAVQPNVFLGRIQFGMTREAHSSVSASSHKNQHRPGSPARPILLSGEDGAALVSPASGKVLCSVVYPQTVASQPILVDLTGDGTDDMLVVSNDAIWGYRIVVETGHSGGFVILVVTLLIGVALAALVQKSHHRRSTDI